MVFVVRTNERAWYHDKHNKMFRNVKDMDEEVTEKEIFYSLIEELVREIRCIRRVVTDSFLIIWKSLRDFLGLYARFSLGFGLENRAGEYSPADKVEVF